MFQCTECDESFARSFNLERHMERFHPQHEEMEEKETDSEGETTEDDEDRVDTDDDDDDDSNDDDADADDEDGEDAEDRVDITPMWAMMRDKAIHSIPHDQTVRFEERVQELVEDDIPEHKASRIAMREIQPAVTSNLYKIFRRKVEEMEELRRDPVYIKIRETRKRVMVDDDFEEDEALYHAIEKRKFLIQKAAGFLDDTSDEEEEEQEGEEDIGADL